MARTYPVACSGVRQRNFDYRDFICILYNLEPVLVNKVLDESSGEIKKLLILLIWSKISKYFSPPSIGSYPSPDPLKRGPLGSKIKELERQREEKREDHTFRPTPKSINTIQKEKIKLTQIVTLR